MEKVTIATSSALCLGETQSFYSILGIYMVFFVTIIYNVMSFMSIYLECLQSPLIWLDIVHALSRATLPELP